MGVGRRAFPHPSLPHARTGMTSPITNPYGKSYVYLQICRTCAAGCAIGPRDGAYSGAFSRVMYRQATHRRQKCAAIRAISVPYVAYSGAFRLFFDERTHERTQENPRNRRTNPGIRRTNPRFCKRTRGTSCRTRIAKAVPVQQFEVSSDPSATPSTAGAERRTREGPGARANPGAA
jgi:hypothetical protein